MDVHAPPAAAATASVSSSDGCPPGEGGGACQPHVPSQGELSEELERIASCVKVGGLRSRLVVLHQGWLVAQLVCCVQRAARK